MRLIDADALMTEFMDSDLDHLQRDDWKEVIQIVQDAPTVQPEQCEDAVSRKTILKFLDSWMSVLEDNVHNQSVSELKIIKKDFENLPSAQPEIVRCKDCKHWIPYDWMFSEVWQSQSINDYPEDEMGCKWCDMSMKANDFCSRADRREVTT